jgi:hypothetical protein
MPSLGGAAAARCWKACLAAQGVDTFKPRNLASFSFPRTVTTSQGIEGNKLKTRCQVQLFPSSCYARLGFAGQQQRKDLFGSRHKFERFELQVVSCRSPLLQFGPSQASFSEQATRASLFGGKAYTTAMPSEAQVHRPSQAMLVAVRMCTAPANMGRQYIADGSPLWLCSTESCALCGQVILRPLCLS